MAHRLYEALRLPFWVLLSPTPITLLLLLAKTQSSIFLLQLWLSASPIGMGLGSMVHKAEEAQEDLEHQCGGGEGRGLSSTLRRY